MSTIRIHTAQNVTLEYEVASPGERIVASLIDYGLYGAWFLAFVLLNQELHFAPDGRAGQALMLLPTTFYMLACEVFFNGQSLGKKARHLRVVRLDGTRAGLGDYLLRWLLRPVEIIMPVGTLAFVTVLLNGRGQRLGDLAAGTTVVSLRPRTPARSALAAEAALIEGYQPVFAQAAVLTDHDVALVRRLLHQGSQQGNFVLLNEVANKVKAVTGIRTDLPDLPFLQTVLRDHAHLVAAGPE